MANFLERHHGELRRITLPRSSVNNGKKKGRSLVRLDPLPTLSTFGGEVSSYLPRSEADLRRSSAGWTRTTIVLAPQPHPENRGRPAPSRNRVREGLSCRRVPGRSRCRMRLRPCPRAPR